MACGRAFAPFCDLPGRDERLWWPEIGAAACRAWTSAAERDEAFRDALRSLVDPGARVDVLFHTHDSGLRMTAARLISAAPIILDANEETLWVIPLTSSDRLVEVSRVDCQICVFDRAMERVAGR